MIRYYPAVRINPKATKRRYEVLIGTTLNSPRSILEQEKER